MHEAKFVSITIFSSAESCEPDYPALLISNRNLVIPCDLPRTEASRPFRGCLLLHWGSLRDHVAIDSDRRFLYMGFRSSSRHNANFFQHIDLLPVSKGREKDSLVGGSEKEQGRCPLPPHFSTINTSDTAKSPAIAAPLAFSHPTGDEHSCSDMNTAALQILTRLTTSGKALLALSVVI